MSKIKAFVCGLIMAISIAIPCTFMIGTAKLYQHRLTEYQQIDPSATKISLVDNMDVILIGLLASASLLILPTIGFCIADELNMNWDTDKPSNTTELSPKDTYESYITELREDLTKLQTIRDSITDVDLKRTLNDILINIEKTIDNISPVEYKMQTFNSFHNVLLPEFIKITASTAALQKDRHKNNIKETYDKVVDVIKKSTPAFENIYAKLCEDDLNSANINASAFSSYLNTINDPFELKM